MLVIAIMIGLVIGSLVLRGKPLPAAAATEGIEPPVKKVHASVSAPLLRAELVFERMADLEHIHAVKA